MIRNAWVTVQETVSGFIIGTLIGFLLGVAIAESMLLRTLLRPYIVAIQAVPKIAVAPLFLIWFGFGMESKTALVVSVVFFPVLVNTVAGFESTKDDQLQLMRAYGASRLQILLRLKLFAALPFIFAAAEVGLVLSLTAAVVAELLGASEGLGAMIQSYGSQLNMPAMFGILIVLSILGVVLHTLVVMVGRRLIFWTGVAGS